MSDNQKKIRLVTAQGPTQLLNVLAILKYQKDVENCLSCEDHLIIGGFATSSQERTHLIIKTCTEIASLWNFKSITYLDIENLRRLGSHRFLDLVKQVKREVNICKVSVLYSCRNWQLFNELLLEAYTDCDKICYGDGYGWLDLDDTKHQRKPFNPRGYAKINSAYLFMPIEADVNAKSFELIEQMVQPPVDYLISTINEAAFAMYDNAQQYCKNLKNSSKSGFTLVLTSNWSEAGVMKAEILDSKNKLRSFLKKYITKFNGVLEHKVLTRVLRNYMPSDLRRKAEMEVAMYFEQLKIYCSKDDIFLIKSHPRETLEQSMSLCRLLSSHGYQAFVIPSELSCYPVELLVNWFEIEKVIGMNSSACFALPLISNFTPDNIYPFIDKQILKKYISEYFMPSSKDVELSRLLLAQSFAKAFNPIRKVGM